MTQWRKIGPEANFREGTAHSVSVAGRRVAVFRSAGEWFAIEDACPHMRARLSEGTLRGCVVTCGWHGWRVDLRTGRALTRSRARVRTCAVRVDGGQVWLGSLEFRDMPPEPAPDGG